MDDEIYDDTDNDDDDILDEPLYPNSDCSTLAFGYLIKVFSIKHSLSGKAVNDLLSIFQEVLPAGNKCPTSKFKLDKSTKQFQHRTTEYHLCNHCHTEVIGKQCLNCNNLCDPMNFFTFDIGFQLQKIITSKFFVIDFVTKVFGPSFFYINI